MKMLIGAVLLGLLMGRFFTDSLPDFAVLFVASIMVAATIFHHVAHVNAKYRALAAYCLSITTASTQMSELIEFWHEGHIWQLAGEIPELIVGAFLVPAIAIAAVYLIMLVRAE
ncbi:hypothetical protein [Pseudomonas mediterranea]|uniref:Disulfide bond formation protein B n=1 Tax=Pseudomonas mediterranea TaxID=183795 RepID=A0AAX2D6B8_9PSED|nr:hypothetical protein [Pseudomonas mediterranea]KGU82284.1 hypothetical protein N005_26830 [Pseudomonas mediterranea CFBP 5447]SDU13697.1 hypothetical protein SAMN05216476_0596 [Pseudomonas mediterranea]